MYIQHISKVQILAHTCNSFIYKNSLLWTKCESEHWTKQFYKKKILIHMITSILKKRGFKCLTGLISWGLVYIRFQKICTKKNVMCSMWLGGAILNYGGIFCNGPSKMWPWVTIFFTRNINSCRRCYRPLRHLSVLVIIRLRPNKIDT